MSLGHIRSKGSVRTVTEENPKAFLAQSSLARRSRFSFSKENIGYFLSSTALDCFEIVDSFAEPPEGRGLGQHAGSPRVPDGGVRGISWIRDPPQRTGQRVAEWGMGVVGGIINANRVFPMESAMPEDSGDVKGVGR